MTTRLTLDFVSDVACPWCAIGLAELERAVHSLAPQIEAQWRFHPFELNPGMPAEGEEVAPYMQRKYGIDGDELTQRQAMVRERAQQAGLHFGPRQHVWNTLDAHRLLYWAGERSGGGDHTQQHALKRALLSAYHERGENPAAPEVLLQAAKDAGLPEQEAAEVIGGRVYEAEVRAEIDRWHAMGISSVPSIIVNERYLIQGGQPAAVFEDALRQIAAEASPAALA